MTKSHTVAIDVGKYGGATVYVRPGTAAYRDWYTRPLFNKGNTMKIAGAKYEKMKATMQAVVEFAGGPEAVKAAYAKLTPGRMLWDTWHSASRNLLYDDNHPAFKHGLWSRVHPPEPRFRCLFGQRKRSAYRNGLEADRPRTRSGCVTIASIVVSLNINNREQAWVSIASTSPTSRPAIMPPAL